MAEPKLNRMTVEQYFDWQLKQDKLFELVDGIPVLPMKMMAGASLRHDRVTVNAILLLGNQLKGRRCRPTTSDVAVRIPKGNIRRPDITVECGEPKSDRELVAADPQVVIEVLSPSTMSFDRFRKLEEYKTVPGLNTILLVDTEAAQVAMHRRDGEAWHVETFEGLDKIVDLAGVGAALPLKDLYDGVAFSAGGMNT